MFYTIQELGGSNSAYCLADHTKLNPSFSSTWPELKSFVSRLNSDLGMISIVDVVLNHTANETDWLRDQPDATYNCQTSPHLRPAFLFDRVFDQLARDIGEGK